MGYKAIKSEKHKEFKMPDIHMRTPLADENAVMNLVREQRKTRGIVIYAKKPLFDKLKTFDEVTTVTYNLDDGLLQNLDRKGEDGYPVYLVSDEYGIRGLDFRAPKNPLGISEVICSPFKDKRTRFQGLMRVGR